MKKKNIYLTVVLFGCFLTLLLPCYGQNCSLFSNEHYTVSVRADKADARYKAGETGMFEIVASKSGAPVDNVQWSCKMLQDELNTAYQGYLKFTAGKAGVPFKFDKPSFMLLIVSPPAITNQKPLVMSGAACVPERLAPSMPKPDDFDAFWNGKKALLNAMTNQPVLTPVPEFTDQQIETYSVCMENINGTRLHAYFSKPRGEGPFPVLLQLYAAGTYSIAPAAAAKYARGGVMALDLNPHDLENGQPESYYKDARSRLGAYYHAGRADRETSYFLRMFCACYRAGQYLANRKEWDKKHFVVHGSSMGGGQALATAYLCPQVTAVAANVPALCDHTGREIGRVAGWPKWVEYQDGKADEKELNASRYFDCVNFAYTIKTKVLMSCGFIDRTCPPQSVYAAYNVLKCDKRMMEMIIRGHEYPPEFTEAWNAFFKAEIGQ